MGKEASYAEKRKVWVVPVVLAHGHTRPSVIVCDLVSNTLCSFAACQICRLFWRYDRLLGRDSGRCCNFTGPMGVLVAFHSLFASWWWLFIIPYFMVKGKLKLKLRVAG